MKKIAFILLMGLFWANDSYSQQDPMLSQYMFNGLYLNPAYAGSHKYWTSTLTYRNQWVGFDGAPETFVAAVDGPLPNKNMGLGLIAVNDRIGVSTLNSVIANYAYQLKLGGEHKLALGANAGFSHYSAKLTELTVWDNDQVFDANLSGKMLPRFGIGAYYFTPQYYAGLSIPTLFSYDNDYDASLNLNKATFLRRHYLLTAGYIFKINKDINLKPSFLLKYVPNTPMEVDLNISAVYKNAIWLGASFRSGDAVVVMAEYQTNAFFRVGYAYDITFSKLRNYSSGSHEIMIGIDFGRDLVKIKTPRYF
jgi:type IX secretion system PorP/SprF family membrane protein